MKNDDFYTSTSLTVEMPFLSHINTHVVVMPTPMDLEPTPKTPLKTRIMRKTLYILKNIGLLLLFMMVAVGITIGFGYLDRMIGAGGALTFFSYIIALFLGVIASQIVFQ